MNAPVTRRTLLGATAAVGAMVLPTVAEAGMPVAHPNDPDAELLDLIARHAEAERGLRDAEEEAERLLEVARAAYPERPEVLIKRPDDFSRTSLGTGLSDPDGDGDKRLYGERAVAWLRDRPASTWFLSLVPALGPECEDRRVEIVEAFDAWTIEMAAVDDRVGWTSADEARDAAGCTFWWLDDAIREHEIRTLPALRAKAAWIVKQSDNGLDETDALLALAREVAAFGVTS